MTLDNIRRIIKTKDSPEILYRGEVIEVLASIPAQYHYDIEYEVILQDRKFYTVYRAKTKEIHRIAKEVTDVKFLAELTFDLLKL